MCQLPLSKYAGKILHEFLASYKFRIHSNTLYIAHCDSIIYYIIHLKLISHLTLFLYNNSIAALTLTFSGSVVMIIGS